MSIVDKLKDYRNRGKSLISEGLESVKDAADGVKDSIDESAEARKVEKMAALVEAMIACEHVTVKTSSSVTLVDIGEQVMEALEIQGFTIDKKMSKVLSDLKTDK